MNPRAKNFQIRTYLDIFVNFLLMIIWQNKQFYNQVHPFTYQHFSNFFGTNPRLFLIDIVDRIQNHGLASNLQKLLDLVLTGCYAIASILAFDQLVSTSVQNLFFIVRLQLDAATVLLECVYRCDSKPSSQGSLSASIDLLLTFVNSWSMVAFSTGLSLQNTSVMSLTICSTFYLRPVVSFSLRLFFLAFLSTSLSSQMMLSLLPARALSSLFSCTSTRLLSNSLSASALKYYSSFLRLQISVSLFLASIISLYCSTILRQSACILSISVRTTDSSPSSCASILLLMISSTMLMILSILWWFSTKASKYYCARARVCWASGWGLSLGESRRGSTIGLAPGNDKFRQLVLTRRRKLGAYYQVMVDCRLRIGDLLGFYQENIILEKVRCYSIGNDIRRGL